MFPAEGAPLSLARGVHRRQRWGPAGRRASAGTRDLPAVLLLPVPVSSAPRARPCGASSPLLQAPQCMVRWDPSWKATSEAPPCPHAKASEHTAGVGNSAQPAPRASATHPRPRAGRYRSQGEEGLWLSGHQPWPLQPRGPATLPQFPHVLTAAPAQTDISCPRCQKWGGSQPWSGSG